jgi:hypothetical protein
MNRYLAALKESYNGIGLATVAAISAATLNPLPLLVGLVAEAAYLVIVPDTKWYQTRLARRSDAEAEQQRQKLKAEVLPTLRPEVQARFTHLEEMRRQIGSQDDKAWYREVVQKLDYLLDKFLLFGAKEAQFRSYLARLRSELHDGDWDLGPARGEAPPRGGSSRRQNRRPDEPQQRPLRLVDAGSDYHASGDMDDAWVQHAVEEVQAHYAGECARIEAQLQTDQDESNRAVLTKRVDVLQRRREFAGKIGKILGNINHQLQLVDDTFGLINDEIRARSPEQILADIDEVCTATDSMSSTLEEIAPYDQMIARVGG